MAMQGCDNNYGYPGQLHPLVMPGYHCPEAEADSKKAASPGTPANH